MTKLAVTFIICFIFANTGTTELNKTSEQVFSIQLGDSLIDANDHTDFVALMERQIL